MRVNRIAAPGWRVDLPAAVTVITDADPLRRTAVVSAFTGLPAVRALDLDGEVEAHGIRLPLAEETLALLGLDHPLEVVVRAAHLPGHNPLVAERAALERELGTVRTMVATGAPPPDRADAEAALAEAAAAHDRLVVRRHNADALTEARRDPPNPEAAAVALEAARERLTGLEATGDPEDRAQRVAALDAERVDAERALAATALVDPGPVRTASSDDELRRALVGAGVVLGDAPVASDLLRSLADRWLVERAAADGRVDALRARLAQIDAERSQLADPVVLDGARAEARDAVVAAEADLADTHGRRAQITELEVVRDGLDPGGDAGPVTDEALASAAVEVERVTAARDRAAAADRVVELEAQLADEPPPNPADDSTLDDTEWYLMTRQADQRGAGLAGSVPLVLDDPFLGLGPDAQRRLLDRLAAGATAVQVVVVTPDPVAEAWARAAEGRAAVVTIDA